MATSASTKTTLHYLDIGTLGRGDVVRILLQDAGIEFEDKRYPHDASWPAVSKEFQANGLSRTGHLPALEYKGEILNQHVSTLRYLSRELGKYDGETSIEKYKVDAVADLYIDWRSQWVSILSGMTDKYKDEYLPKFYDLAAQYYSDVAGPYLLGDKITYADFAIYKSICDDDHFGALPSTLPEPLLKLKEAIEGRPNLAEYLKARSKKD